MSPEPLTPSRRDLLRLSAGAALLGGLGLRQEPEPGDSEDPEDYRALVCVNLNGGVDGFSFALPRTPSEYAKYRTCLLYTSPSPRDQRGSRMPSSA